MSAQPPHREPTEEELRAYEEQLRAIGVADVLIQTAVSLVNLGGRRLGLSPGTEGERDLAQVRDAIDAVRALLPVLERNAPADALRPLRDAVSQLQLEYAKVAQAQAQAQAQPAREQPPADAEKAPAQPGSERPDAGDEGRAPGPAEASGRLWTPGR